MFVVCSLFIAVCCVLVADCCVLLDVHYLVYVVSWLVGGCWFADCRLLWLFAVCCLLTVDWCSFDNVCCSLSNPFCVLFDDG